jgi:acyl carrier protein
MVAFAEFVDRVKKTVCPLTVPPTSPDGIRLEDRLIDLGLDSLTFLEMVVALEEEFGVRFEDERLTFEALPTVESVVGYVGTLLGDGTPSGTSP